MKYSHDFFVCLKKNIWISAVCLVVFLLLCPFSAAAVPSGSIFNLEVTHLQLKFRLFHPDTVPAILAVLPVAGIVTALFMFRFLLNKKDTSIYLALGITRTRLFINRSAAGILMIFFGIAVPMAVSYALNVAALGGYQCLLRNTIYLTLGMCIASWTAFFIGATAVFLSGTVTEAVIIWAGIMAFPTLITSGLNMILKKLFWGNAFGEVPYNQTVPVSGSLLERGAFWNPILFLQRPLETNGQFVRPLETDIPPEADWTLIAGWAAVCIALAVVSLILLKKRHSECAGTRRCHPVPTEPVIFAVCGFVFAAVLYFMYDHHVLLAFVLAALVFAGLQLILRKLVFSDGAKRLSSGKIISILTHAALIAAVCLVCGIAVNGIALRILKQADITEAEVTYTGAPAYLNGEPSGSTTGRGYYLQSTVSFHSKEAVELARNLQRDLILSGRRPMESAGSIADTVVPYDLIFRYTEQNGRKHTFYYDRASLSQLEAMLQLEETKEAQQARNEMFGEDGNASFLLRSWYAYQNYSVYVSDPSLLSIYQLTLPDGDRDDLLRAVGNDLAEISPGERYFPETGARAVIMFSNSGEQDCKYFTYHLDNAFLYITDSFTETLEWLRENGIYDLIDTDPQAEYAVLQKYDPYIGINRPKSPSGLYFMAYCADSADEFQIQKDFGKKYTINDPDQLEQLMPLLKDGVYMSRGGYFAAVKFRGYDRFRYFFLPEYDVPDFVK